MNEENKQQNTDGASPPASAPPSSKASDGHSESSGDREEKIAKLEKERDEYLAGWQRARADFINYKKEELRHLEEIARYSTEDLLKDLIMVVDNFDLGLAAMEKAGPVERGVYIIKSQIEDMLKRRGVEKISMKRGDPFDPAIAEALGEIEADGPPGAVAEEIEPGYRLHDKIIRPAKVKLTKHKE